MVTNGITKCIINSMEVINLKAVIDNSTYFDAQLFHGSDGNISSVQLHFTGYDSGIIKAKNAYSAMQQLHEKLDENGIKLLCNCYRYDIRPSGMSLSMGGGAQGYKLILGQSAKELVNIFEPTFDIEAIVSVDEQKKFYRKWINSLI